MLDQITKVLREYKDDDSLAVAEATTFAELELDSLDVVELLMNLEEEFDVTIEMDESIKMIGDLMKAIEAAK